MSLEDLLKKHLKEQALLYHDRAKSLLRQDGSVRVQDAIEYIHYKTKSQAYCDVLVWYRQQQNYRDERKKHDE